ncbi:sulfurtransferase [Vibrio galatheae]|uniref:Sulfurtransferase n=1 Tax=Vibrio galatheae TaxID=579748 RepID=A0A0F4NG03_9VIBR|nr:rhodanese-like domain-containing protein [Vibrio galatheae]KJY81884.1 sulfurtransferase [Vibrio galatheae]
MKRLILVVTLLASFGLPVAASERAEIGWQWIEQGAMVVDVRTEQEFAAGHLDQAVNFPLSELEKHFAHIDKDTQIVLYCRSGNRSGQAYQYLKSQGFTNLHNAGGLGEIQNAK